VYLGVKFNICIVLNQRRLVMICILLETYDFLLKISQEIRFDRIGNY
jgi:hypothetical protein